MATMTTEDALQVYSILDENIGVFRQEEMPERAVEFYEKKKQDFIELFTTELPETYWFQGVDLNSVTLHLDLENGFYVVPEVSPENASEPVIEITNEKLREANLSINVSAVV